MNKKPIAVTIGDIEGIGIELLIKLWKLKKIDNFILITNNILFQKMSMTLWKRVGVLHDN